jgi:hypothetical protein
VAQARRRRRGYGGSDGSTDDAAEVECVGEVVLTPAPRRGMGAGSEPGREAVGAVADDSGGAGGGWRRLPYPPRSRGFGRHPSFSREPPGHRCSTGSFIAFLREVIPCAGADGPDPRAVMEGKLPAAASTGPACAAPDRQWVRRQGGKAGTARPMHGPRHELGFTAAPRVVGLVSHRGTTKGPARTRVDH